MSDSRPEIVSLDLAVTHGSNTHDLFCDIESPRSAPLGTLLIAHGFMGYKDYGMFPFLAKRATDFGWTAIRFNFSHSGMTRTITTFEREDLFENDTWNKQVEDLNQLVASIRAGQIPYSDPAQPIVLLGHSRGGMASILFSGRGGDVEKTIVVAAGAEPLPVALMEEGARTQLREAGYVTARSSRTGQELRIGRGFLDSVEADPESHDITKMAERIGDRLVIVHGDSDPTVDVENARRLAAASGTTATVVEGGDHVFNVKNPFATDGTPSPQLLALADVLENTLRTCPAREDVS